MASIKIRPTLKKLITTNPVRSLVWCGDDLIDWVAGGTRYQLDGNAYSSRINYAYKFDHAIASHCGTYVALVESLGTKGIILKNREILREINRSFYRANDYLYPITFLQLPDGSVGLAHCPDNYSKIEIEEVETGRRLTERDTRPCDIFHSRLQVSDDGKYLLSAGWVWHPLDGVWVFDVPKVLNEPKLLDEPSAVVLRVPFEATGAIFRSPEQLVISSSAYDDYNPKDPDQAEEPGEQYLDSNCIGIYDLPSQSFITKTKLEEATGQMMSFGDFVVAFYKHPKLIDLNSGQILRRWTELLSGEQCSSITRHLPPPLAIDRKNKRFAVGSKESIDIVQFEMSSESHSDEV
jgi:hypothetical protein